MPLIKVREDESLENALKRFKRKCEKSKAQGLGRTEEVVEAFGARAPNERLTLFRPGSGGMPPPAPGP